MPELQRRPNILLIMADQFRADHLGAAGADFVRTPNLDRIAGEGVPNRLSSLLPALAS